MIKHILITIAMVFAIGFICSPDYIRYERNGGENPQQNIEDIYMKDIFEGSL